MNERKKEKLWKDNMANNGDDDNGSGSDDDTLGVNDVYQPLTEEDLQLDSVLLDDLHT